MENLQTLINRVEVTHKKYLEEKKSFKEQVSSLTSQIEELTAQLNDANSQLEEANTVIESLSSQLENATTKLDNINSINIEKEKGFSIREKQLVDKFKDFKQKTYLTIKHLVENVIEANDSKEKAKLSLRYAEDELKDLVKESNKTVNTNIDKVKFIQVK